ncbi:glycerol-3-phosphate acyltransferase PlsY [Pseudobutyrivibrio sp. YE44]|uniref:glycerol-3-phosphate acyltransferase n=1 Tax=Pseudobutyrivibrio sp. YE44 TaxID=1520802 RepID=UPI00088E470A|nr:glycerol-3-phosphate acyltransferase [Pseudobutyrivibrio sp. YE44]SDB10301.1 glycerol-3-phosphate acyltransferase PlsY [Pseudobutyrivibrio sp. YE44]
MIIGRIIAVLIGYCFGMILMGYLIGKSKHIDLTKVGSGNVGSTNTMRNLGVPAGLITLAWDCTKCIVAGLFVWLTFSRFVENGDAWPNIYMIYAGLGCVLGHDFPCYMKFKGGKGIASTLGFIIAFFPKAVFIPACIFIAIVAITRYVSLGSIIGVLSFAIEIVLAAHFGILPFEGTELTEVVVICIFVAALGITLHHANIKRLLNGNENKFSFHPETRA